MESEHCNELDVERICRVCLEEKAELFLIFDTGPHPDPDIGATISEIISECTRYRVERFDEMPHHICGICMEAARSAYSFKRKTEDAYRTLLNLLKLKEPAKTGHANISTQTDRVSIHPCELCDRKFFDILEKRSHRQMEHRGEILKCKVCSSKFENLRQLRSHLAVEHPGEGVTSVKIKCPLCRKLFSRRDHMKRHMRNIHKTDTYKYYFIDDNDENGSNSGEDIEYRDPLTESDHRNDDMMGDHKIKIEPDSIETNQIVNRNKKICCKLCDKKFLQKFELKMHLSRDHLEERKDKKYLRSNTSLDEPEIDVDSSNAPQSIMSAGIKAPLSDSVKSDPENENNDEPDANINPFLSDDQMSVTNLDIKSEGSAGDITEDDDGGIEGELVDDFPVENNLKIEEKNDLASESVNCAAEDNTEESRSKTRSKRKVVIIREYEEKSMCRRRKKVSTAASSAIDDQNNSESSTCDECGRKFARHCHLLRHKLTHTGEKPHACKHCGKRFTRSDHLKKHVINLHGEKDFKCDQCNSAFAQESALLHHKDIKHDTDPALLKIHTCDYCSKKFMSKTYLRKHILMHTDRIFVCKHCDETFKERKPCREHEKTHTAIERNYLCSMCGESFARADYLRVHMRRHTGEKPYKCQFCEKRFPRATDVKMHERYHTGTKPNKCNLCDKAFHRAYNLTIHMRTHTGERPYKCEHCPQAFAQSNDLKAHIRRHTGERFKCPQCDSVFLQMYGLRQHALTVHDIRMESSTGRIQKFPVNDINASATSIQATTTTAIAKDVDI